MRKSIALIVLLATMLSLTACGSKLNPTWYPLGPGKDTVCFVGNGKFSLGKLSTGIILTMYTSENDNNEDVLLAFVNSYKIKDDKLYVYSDEGYCVIDIKSNTAKLLITAQKQYFDDLASEYEEIFFLSSYDDFEAEDKKVFEKMVKKSKQ